jgi:hypothetical protein
MSIPDTRDRDDALGAPILAVAPRWRRRVIQRRRQIETHQKEFEQIIILESRHTNDRSTR